MKLREPTEQVYSSMQLKNKIRISVCIPNYNRSGDLDDVLKDCMSQTSLPYEIIIQDDSYDQKEIKKINRVIARYKKVKYYRNKKNIGLASNVNRVVKRAKGDYVVIVNNDDRLSTFYIEEIQKAIEKYPKHSVYTTNACAITDEGKVFGDYRLFENDTLIKPKIGIIMLWKNFFLNLISVSGATIYERKFLQKNLFVPELGNEADLNNALKLLSGVNIMYIHVPIYYVRMNAANTSIEVRATNQRLEAYIRNCIAIYSQYGKQFKNTPHYLTRPKTVFFLQLKIKYNYPLKNVNEIIGIRNLSELIEIILLIPGYILAQLKFRLLFQIHRFSYQKYFPQIRNV